LTVVWNCLKYERAHFAELLMRVTAQAKKETCQRIIAAAVERFKAQGFAAATTRDIARQARIAAGTLFNYFPSKDAIVLALADDALTLADTDFERTKRAGASLPEDLFQHIAAGLRRLKRHRAYLGVLVQAALSPLVETGSLERVDAIRERQLGRVQDILTEHSLPDVSPVAVQLYWTLYLGVLSYWISDRSPKQEDSLALIDQSVTMFCDWLCRHSGDHTLAEAKP
jgi:AcrR family transcriptional regulator